MNSRLSRYALILIAALSTACTAGLQDTIARRVIEGRMSDMSDPTDYPGLQAVVCGAGSPLPSREAAGQALLRGDYGEAERLTAPLIAACPVDPSFHLWRFASLAIARWTRRARATGRTRARGATGGGRRRASPRCVE